ncbi:hypothetical protein [Kitasatospora sp. HPMI-4]|uniref:hypothetical protein n=1 Tax=Kitasatospora sp. HPMI-4 TaxID=3448443 RepID=UPI003F1D5E49
MHSTHAPLALPRISYAEIHGTLEILPTDLAGPVVLDNRGLVGHLADPDNFARLVREICATDALRGEIAARSYRHTNHFDKIVLADTGHSLGYRLTLHLWNPPYTEDELEDETIHDHRFSFWSAVLAGNLVSENFVRSADGPAFQEWRYFPDKNGLATTSNFYDFVGETGLTGTEASHTPAGNSYFLTYESVHRVLLPRTETVATLVLRSPRQRAFANVFNITHPRDERKVKRNTMFTEEQLVDRLDLVLKAMEAAR